jgi:YD repeat-containing protein
VVKFAYDTEEQLISVTNEKEEVYRFERDTKGNIVRDTGFDNVTRTYERDLSGLVKQINRPDSRWTKFSYDKLGNVIRTDYFDGTWDTFGYNKNNELIDAANQHTALKFECNPAGHVTKEWQDCYWVSSEYDEIGNRLQITSSLGAKIDTKRDTIGQSIEVTATQSERKTWTAHTEYNEWGLEICRLLPGDVTSNSQYDAMGKQTQHHIQTHHRDTRLRSYNWDINNQLKKMTNELTSRHTTYGYDEFSNLVWADNSERFGFINRSADDVGNIFESQDKTDRIYGAGSRLEQSGVDTKQLRSRHQGGFSKQGTKGTSF